MDDLVIYQPYIGGQVSGRANDWDYILYAMYDRRARP